MVHVNAKQRSSSNQPFLTAGTSWNTVCMFVFDRMKDHKINPVSLCFVDKKLEEHYSSEKEKRSGAAFSCCIIVLFFITAMEVFIDPLWVNASYLLDHHHLNIQMKVDFFHSTPWSWICLSKTIVCLCFCRLVVNYVTLAIGEVLLLTLTLCSLAAIFPRVSEWKKILIEFIGISFTVISLCFHSMVIII